MLKVENIEENDTSLKLINRGEGSNIYLMSDGRIAKFLGGPNLTIYNIMEVDIYKKLELLKELEDIKELYVPQTAINTSNGIIGYTMNYNNGKSFNEIDDSKTIEECKDLPRYLRVHRQINDLVKRLNERNVVLPDLLTCDNMLFDSNENLSMIDIDGLQVGDCCATAISTSLGNPEKYIFTKKYIRNFDKMLYTPELDKKSLMYLFFLDIFNTNLDKIGTYSPVTKKIITLKELLTYANIDNVKLERIIKSNIDDVEHGEYLDKFYDFIEKRYNLSMAPITKDKYLKSLVKKR